MDYQLVGFAFACVGAVMSVLYFGLGVSFLRVLRKRAADDTPSPK